TEQELCIERYVMVNASGEIETLDGAISASFPQQAMSILEPGESDEVSVAAQADLHEVRGSLRIDPAVPPPRVGRLDLTLQFESAKQDAFGVLGVGVYPDWDIRDQDAERLPSELSSYRPLQGWWGNWH
ncbi:MAG TPA: hypothetical protein VK509_05460, partial [Polyangiales bacterium]|nr:hypothetical protein [Polyangiales bacterium]